MKSVQMSMIDCIGFSVIIKLGTGSLISETGHPFLSLPRPHVVHVMFVVLYI